MDDSFISVHNIDNIYEYLNTIMIKTHHINLNNDEKNKKIVKKLTKTIFNELNNNVDNHNTAMNNFNELVLKKCKPFLLDKITNPNTIIKPKKRKQKKYKVKTNKKKMNFNENSELLDSSSLQKNASMNSFVEDQNAFDNMVKESNKQINNSFNEFKSKNSNNNFKANSKCSVG